MPAVSSHPVRVEHGVEVAVVGVGSRTRSPHAASGFGGDGQRLRIAVDADHAIGAAFEQGPGVPAKADRAVHEQCPLAAAPGTAGLFDHHRQVLLAGPRPWWLKRPN